MEDLHAKTSQRKKEPFKAFANHSIQNPCLHFHKKYIELFTDVTFYLGFMKSMLQAGWQASLTFIPISIEFPFHLSLVNIHSKLGSILLGLAQELFHYIKFYIMLWSMFVELSVSLFMRTTIALSIDTGKTLSICF